MTKEITIGQALRMFRKSLGWTQAEMGEKTGLGKMHVARLEGPRSNPTLKTLRKFMALGFRFGIEAMVSCSGLTDHYHLKT